MDKVDWNRKTVLVTGGASFIGSHLVDALVARGAWVRIVDDLSSGRYLNIKQQVETSGHVEFEQADLRDPGRARWAMRGVHIVFHLAADHGGRGYVDLHQAGPASNLFLDGVVFWEALRAGVEKVVYASSGCVYPNCLQRNPTEEVYLRERDVRPPHDADNMYGWAKLMGELTLKSYFLERGLASVSLRYFTVYGPRGVENHAVMAMIARAFVKQHPFEVWGDGQQIRNWTYVSDIIDGTILAAEIIADGRAVNLGTMERIRVVEAVNLVQEYTGNKIPLKFCTDMPVGPANRVADNRLAQELLGWEPKVKFADGLKKTIEWYYATHRLEEVSAKLESMLTGRG